MRLVCKIIIAYFPILLTAFQLFINGIYFINESLYNYYSFYFANTLGTSFIFSFFLVIYTSYFKFCSVSKIASYAQMLLSIAYLVIQKDDVYNIVFQSVVMIMTLIITGYYYVKKYPKCKFSLYVKGLEYSVKLWKSFLASLSNSNFECEKAFEDYKLKRKHHYQNG